ncbi:Serine/threonine kinase [Salix suchowensis]|nr:Serine/threonine kinase [Salix suchowensis]
MYFSCISRVSRGQQCHPGEVGGWHKYNCMTEKNFPVTEQKLTSRESEYSAEIARTRVQNEILDIVDGEAEEEPYNHAQELDQKIQEVYKHIQTERKILQASKSLAQATTNQDVLRRNEAKIRETERTLSYFEETLRELQARKLQGGDPSRSSYPGSPQESRNSYGESRPKPRTYTNLDLIKADTPLTPAKISKMLHQMEFKLQVEMQYKQGIDKMAKLYQADGDKKSRADAESKRVESEKKIQLLQSALKRYKNLHVLDDVAEDEDPGPSSYTVPASGEPDSPLDGTQGDRKDNLRAKPLSGTLYVTVKGARELEHAPMPTFSRLRSSSKQITETQISIKVEGTQAARTHPSRTDRWNEDFEITVDKANEVEITVYDKQGSDPNPSRSEWCGFESVTSLKPCADRRSLWRVVEDG